MLALHRMRSHLVKSRTAQVNQLRGLLYEFGIALRGGHQAGLEQIRARMTELEQTVPAILTDAIKEQLGRIGRLDGELQKIERQMSVEGRTRRAGRLPRYPVSA